MKIRSADIRLFHAEFSLKEMNDLNKQNANPPPPKMPVRGTIT